MALSDYLEMTVEEALTSSVGYCCGLFGLFWVLAVVWSWIEENSDSVMTVIWVVAIGVWIYCLAMLSDIFFSDYHSASGLTIGTLYDMMSTIYCSTCLVGVVVMVLITWSASDDARRTSLEISHMERENIRRYSELDNQVMTYTSIQIAMRLARGEDWDPEKITVKELEHMLKSLSLPASGNKRELISRIENWYKLSTGEQIWLQEKTTVKQLKEILRILGLPVSGNKSELVSRIEIWYEEQGFGSDFIKADEEE